MTSKQDKIVVILTISENDRSWTILNISLVLRFLKLKKITKDASPELSTRLKHTLVSVNGSTEQKDIRNFVDNFFLARDSRAFREHLTTVQPDVDLKFYPEDGPEGGVPIPIGISFLWPDAGI